MIERLKSVLLQQQVVRDWRDGRALRRKSGFPIFLDYELRSTPRYGYGKPAHPLLHQHIDANRERYKANIQEIARFRDALKTIPATKPDDPEAPYWSNGFLEGLDAASLYAFVSARNPRNYIEIGSGNSTKFARKAIRDHQLRTRIVSIDPHPRAEIDRLCDEVVRSSLEDVDLKVFDALEPGDILIVDGSHRSYMNSDVTVVFLEILPKLKPGVLVYIDDIYLPFDYPPEWVSRYYSEQYLLAVMLLATQGRYAVSLPCNFISLDPELKRQVGAFWTEGPMAGVHHDGNGFWLDIV